jgi:hypothetical protein
MSDVRVQQRFSVHGEHAIDNVRVDHNQGTAWIRLVNDPEVIVFFRDGLRGRDQMLALIAQLETAALAMVEHVDQTLDGRVVV